MIGRDCIAMCAYKWNVASKSELVVNDLAAFDYEVVGQSGHPPLNHKISSQKELEKFGK
jgi:hypothetical protein